MPSRQCCDGILAQIDTTGGPHALKVVGVGALRSYEHMGMASITCMSGCNCPDSILQGTHPTHTSVEVWHHLAVRAFLILHAVGLICGAAHDQSQIALQLPALNC